MKKLLPYLFVILAVVHFVLLNYYGIASFTTTLLFYYIVYQAVAFFIRVIRNKDLRKIILVNTRIILIFLLFFEFSLTFIFKILNNYMENERGIYFSEYKRQPQLNLLHAIGKKEAQLAWQNGYLPYTGRDLRLSNEFNYHFKTNLLGLRGPLPSIKKDSGEYRIIVLGDSYVEGFGTSNDSTFPVLLQSRLTNNYKKLSVINAGICGSNPIYEAELYQNKLKEYKPDLVLMVIDLTDISDVNFALHQDKMPVTEYFYAISHIFRILYANVLGNNIFNDNAPLFLKADRKAAINQIIKSVKRFNETLIKNDQNLILVYLPWKEEILSKNVTDAHLTPSLISSLSSSGLPLIDLKSEYKRINLANSAGLDIYYWKHDGHHTPKGYDMMAKIISDSLIKKYSVYD